MTQNPGFHPRRMVAALLAVLVHAAATAPPVQAAPFVTVRVTIERIRALDDFEGNGAEDFYACVSIGGTEACNEDTPSSDEFEDMEDISPNWEFSRPVDAAAGSTNVVIEIRDEDGFFRLGDDHVDVTGNSGRNLGITVSFIPCAVTGEVSGGCETSLVTSGTSDEKAELTIRVEVGATPSTSNLNLTCTHSPAWPQAGQTVTVRAASLTGSLSVETADSIELWINDKVTPAQTESAVNRSSMTVGPFTDGSSFFYGCRVFDGDDEVWSGWHVVQVGMPSEGRAVPVLNTGPQASRIDIVFVPEKDSYTGPSDSLFQFDVERMIDMYYSEFAYLRRQDHLNFWIALDEGDAQDDCDSEAPDNWDDDYTFADVGAITHRDESVSRDCAVGDRIFSGKTTGGISLEGRVYLHETGHTPFGLADEYEPDGGYYMADPFPNLYGPEIAPIFEQMCIDDIASLQPFDILLGFAPRQASDCRLLETDSGLFWTSDPSGDHVMGIDMGTVRGADLRQMEYLFEQCRLAGC